MLKINNEDSLYYVFECDIVENTAVEYVVSCAAVHNHANYISHDVGDDKAFEDLNHIVVGFTQCFLTCYYKLANKFDNLTTESPEEYFTSSKILDEFLERVFLPENLEQTKTDYHNIKIFLKDERCHNLNALECFCGFMDKTIPQPIENLLNKASLEMLADKDSYYHYLDKNVKRNFNRPDYIDAECALGMNPTILKIYEINSIMDLFLVTLHLTFLAGSTIKICKICGLPFTIYTRKDTQYCSYYDKKCKIEARRQKERERYKDAGRKYYKTIYMTFSGRVNNSKLKDDTLEWNNLQRDFTDYNYEYKLMVKSGKLSFQDYLQWLESVKSLLRTHKSKLFEIPTLQVRE